MRDLSGFRRRLVMALTACGALLLVVEVVWITWGVFARYVLRSPDRYVTEATALFLMPLAFVGLAYALSLDAFPKVTLIVERFPPALARFLGILNRLIMVLVGLLFTVTTAAAAFRSFNSGASSNVLGWPEFAFWVPVSISLGVFTALALLEFLSAATHDRRPRQSGSAG